MLRVKDANIDVGQLYELFSPYDEIKMNLRKGVAYVIFKDPIKAELALKDLNGKMYNQKALKINHYQWTGEYEDDENSPEPVPMEIEEVEQFLPAAKMVAPSNHQFHPVIQQLREQFLEAMSTETQQLDKGIKKAELQIRSMLIPKDAKQSKLKNLKQFVVKEQAKMKKFLNQMQVHICSKYQSLYNASIVDLESGIHQSKSSATTGEEKSSFQFSQQFVSKNPITKLLKVSNSEFMAAFAPASKGSHSQGNNVVSLYALNDAKPKHSFNKFSSPVTSLAIFTSSPNGPFTWGMFGEDSGKLQSLQLDPLDRTCNQNFPFHSNPILDIKPLKTHAHDNVEHYLTYTSRNIKKWYIETEETFANNFALDIKEMAINIQVEGTIACLEVLSKTNVIASLHQSKIKLFDIQKEVNVFTLPTQKPSMKIIKIDPNSFASINNKDIVLRDIRKQKSISAFSNPQTVTSMVLFDQHRIFYGGEEMIGFVDWKKNASLWRDVTSHPKSQIKDLIVVDKTGVSADSAERLISWELV